jgi:hypothetical protein
MESNYSPFAFNLLIWINLYAIFVTFVNNSTNTNKTNNHLSP